MNIGAGTYEFVSNRPQFEAHAHTVSAVTMFAGIVLVILINALSAGGRGNAKVFVRLYGLIAITMGVALAIIVVIRWKNPDWSHLAIYVEFVLIVTFAVFWGVQTKELWNCLRPARAASGRRRSNREMRPPPPTETSKRFGELRTAIPDGSGRSVGSRAVTREPLSD